MTLRFRCVEGCNHCCIWRGYYVPVNAVAFNPETGKYVGAEYKVLGKRGIELEVGEVHKISRLARKLRSRVDDSGTLIPYIVLPSSGLGRNGASEPEKVETYQLMGRTGEGDICPFLSTITEGYRTEDGMLKCLIYEDRPLVCRNYPVNSMLKNKFGEQFARVELNCQWVACNFEKWMVEPFHRSEIVGLNYDGMVRKQTRLYNSVGGDEEKTLFLYATGYHNHDDAESPVAGRWVDWGFF